jgi:hypothetical protein
MNGLGREFNGATERFRQESGHPYDIGKYVQHTIKILYNSTHVILQADFFRYSERSRLQAFFLSAGL